MATGKMRIMLRGYDAPLLEQATEQILDAAARTGAQIAGPVPMPTRRRRFTVIRSPHITKDSREHFEHWLHKRLVDIVEPSSKTMDVLQRLNVPNGVEVSVKVIQ